MKKEEKELKEEVIQNEHEPLDQKEKLPKRSEETSKNLAKMHRKK